MGIKNFNSWIKNSFPDSVNFNLTYSKYDYIYVDVNHILHSSINNVYNIKQFLNKISFYLNSIFFKFIATKKIILAVDGSPPFSKIILQRKRRLTHNSSDNKINSLHLTPGTDLMSHVNKFLFDYVKILKSKYKFLKTKFIISSSNDPGEGELKIFKYLNQYTSDSSSCHLVIGNDADLVVLALATLSISNIDILLKYKKQKYILSIHKLLSLYNNYILSSVNNFSNFHFSFSSNDLRKDFVFLSLFFGNDYFPKLSFINYNTLFNSYIQYLYLYHTPLLIDFSFHSLSLEFFNILIFHIRPQYRHLDLHSYSPSLVHHYLSGLLWCSHMYSHASCPMIDFMYHYDKAPSPFDIYFYFLTNDFNIKCPVSNIKSISSNLCPLLLLPKNATNIIPSKFHKYIDTIMTQYYDDSNFDIKKLKSIIDLIVDV